MTEHCIERACVRGLHNDQSHMNAVGETWVNRDAEGRVVSGQGHAFSESTKEPR